MNSLVEALIEGIISEEEQPKKKIIGMFGGGFKPPTSGHLEVVKRALEENPEMDALIILVGSGTRDTVTQSDSIAIWNIYKKYLPNKVRVMASPDNKPPIGAIYSYARKNPDKEIYYFVGAREGNEEDFKDIAIRTASLRKGNHPNIKVKEIVSKGAVSGTKARKALLAKDKETFSQFFPDIPEVDKIWDILTDVVEERISFKPEFDETEVEFIEDFADDKMQPDVDIDLSGQHFFDRLNDPRNYPDIEPYELEDFFEKLSDEKDEFITFLKKYRNVVVKDTETNINIPFMKAANKAIAKTIMRKKNFKTPDAILPLKEGRYDAEVTMISRMVVNVFKDAFGEKFETTFEDAGELDGDTFELETYFYPTPFDELGPIPFIINAAGDGDGIAIQVNYNPDSFPTAYNELIPEIKDAVRHELEHVSQYRNPNKEIKPGGVNQDDLPLYDYLTLDYEIPAFVQGLYKKAKTKKITLTKAIDDFLDERAEELSSDEEVKIKKIYTDWAKKNLPSAQFEGLSSKEQDIVDDILSEVNNLQEVDLDKLKEKIKLYGRKGMLTLSILLSVASGLQANPGTAKDIVDVGIEMVDTKGKTDFYNSMIGYISEIKQQAFKSGGDINMIGSLKELQLHYQALRDNETPAPLSTPAKASQESILKNMADLDMNTIQDYISMGQGTTIINEADPKKGTGKKPKGSGRRLYTDEDPKDTVKIKFSTRQDIVDTLNKTSFKNKSHARQSQVINLIHQRVRAAYGRSKKPEVKKRLKSALDYITKRKEASKAKTQRLKKQKANENVAPNHDQKSSPYGSGYKPLKEELTPHIISLTQFMGSNGLNLKPYPKVKFIDNDVENSQNIFGRTAYYDPNQRIVALYTMGRHPKDILRSYAHELIHHHQNLNNTLDHSQTTNTNEDDALDKIEREAYENGNILFRNWEDQLKND